MQSIILDGKVLDFRYAKRAYGYVFFIGDVLIGEVFSPTEYDKGWVAVSHYKSHAVCPVSGFRTRYDAALFLLKLNDLLLRAK